MKTTHITATFGTIAGVITLFWFAHLRITHYWQSVVIMTRQFYQWTPQTVFCLLRGWSGFAPRTGRRIIRCRNLALYITDCVSLCLSDETLKAVGPFYLVSMPGEVKYPTSLHWRYVTCRGLHILAQRMTLNYLNHSCVSPQWHMGCLE